MNKIITMIERDVGGLNSAIDINTTTGDCFGFVLISNLKLKDFVRQIIAR